MFSRYIDTKLNCELNF